MEQRPVASGSGQPDRERVLPPHTVEYLADRKLLIPDFGHLQ